MSDGVNTHTRRPQYPPRIDDIILELFVQILCIAFLSKRPLSNSCFGPCFRIILHRQKILARSPDFGVWWGLYDGEDDFSADPLAFNELDGTFPALGFCIKGSTNYFLDLDLKLATLA